MTLTPTDPNSLKAKDIVLCHFPKSDQTRVGKLRKHDGELYVIWLKGEGFVSLNLLIRDMKLNGSTLYKV